MKLLQEMVAQKSTANKNFVQKKFFKYKYGNIINNTVF